MARKEEGRRRFFESCFQSQSIKIFKIFSFSLSTCSDRISHPHSLHCRYFNETVHHDLFHNKILFIKTLTSIPSTCHQSFPSKIYSKKLLKYFLAHNKLLPSQTLASEKFWLKSDCWELTK